MQIILLSGGSGKRLWPLSNGIRSKQFLRLLTAPDGSKESMVQRVVRQIRKTIPDCHLTIATSESQKDPIISQLGTVADIVTEPERRDTFPAIILASAYLFDEKKIDDDETIVVMPCDQYTDDSYFKSITKMIDAVENDMAEIMLLGITPKEASSRYGYMMPKQNDASSIDYFIEKPSRQKAEELLSYGAVWNGGVFAFKLGYIKNIAKRYLPENTFKEFRNRFAELPKISFDYEVVEKANSLGVVYYDGLWKDLGTWDSLSQELHDNIYGYAIESKGLNNTIINELDIPVICHGTSNLIIAASPDGILVSDKPSADILKESVSIPDTRPMYEERRWGSYRVVDNTTFNDGFCALTKQLTLNPGCNISYQKHTFRDEVWTFIDGKGEIVLNGTRKPVERGDTITIPAGTLHALRAITSLTFIEVQRGTNLIEEDIERFDFKW